MIRFIKKHKLLSAVMILLIVGLITVSLVWFFAVKMDYIKWADTVGKMENSLGDIEDKRIEGDYIFFVKQPRYLRDNGFPEAPLYQVPGYKLSKAKTLKGRCDVHIEDSIKNFLDFLWFLHGIIKFAKRG